MQTASRKRKVSSCIPCYTRKQKCSRQYPCNHCTRRGRPGECVYYTSPGMQEPPALPLQTSNRSEEYKQCGTDQGNGGLDPELLDAVSSLKGAKSPTNTWPASLAEVFGYSEGSNSNTMALLRRLGLREEECKNNKGPTVPHDTAIEVQRTLDKMPDRAILDFLVRYFVAEVDWIDQLVYIPLLLEQYQQWWSLGRRPSSVVDVEFAVLLLRICSYASQFLPSPSYTIERIRGMFLSEIRSVCDDIADTLAGICTRLDARGSLLRVQHLCFAGLKSQCEGRTNVFWESLSSAMRVAQRIGVDRDASGVDGIEKASQRRVFCNLYIWDSRLSRQLDRATVLSSGLSAKPMPYLHLVPDADDDNHHHHHHHHHHDGAPDGFTERILQACLVDFWRNISPQDNPEYDIIQAEERYETLCREFLATLPSNFSLQHPNRQWDERLPMLPLQRQIFHISIYDSMCHNFRPALLQDAGQVQGLPKYKQVLLSSQQRALAAAALNVLKGVSTLHAMMGRSQTRFAGVILPTFEAAVLLVLFLCMHQDPLGESDAHCPGTTTATRTAKADPLGAGIATLKRDECIQAVRDALSRLQMLAEVSTMAEVGAQTLAQLVSKVVTLPGGPQKGENASMPTNEISGPINKSWSDTSLPEYSDLVSLSGLDADTPFDVVDMNWEALASDL